MSDSAPATLQLPRAPAEALLALQLCTDLRPMTETEQADFPPSSDTPCIGSVGGLTVLVDGSRLDFFDARSTSWTNLDWSCFRLVSAVAAACTLLVVLAAPADARGNSAGLRSGGDHHHERIGGR